MPPDANGAETFAEKLTRVRAEVAKLRASLDAQLDTGKEKSTGVFRVAEVDFPALERRLKAKESELARLEAINSGDTTATNAALGFVQIVTRGMPA